MRTDIQQPRRTGRRLLGALGAGLALVGAFTVTDFGPAAAEDPVSVPYSAVGTIAEVTEVGFRLNPITTASANAQKGITDDGSLSILYGPTTGFYKKTPSGTYRKSTAELTLIVGDDVRVVGRRFTREDETMTFSATYVWNPPNTGGGGGYPVPVCGATTGMANHNFSLVGTVLANRVRLPCTGLGGLVSGIILDVTVPPGTAAGVRGVAAYGGRPDIYVHPLTKYVRAVESPPGSGTYKNVVSDWASVVRLNTPVKVYGRYYHAAGAYLFVAKAVYSPPPAAPGVIRVIQTQSPVSTDGRHFEGSTDGTSFRSPGSKFVADMDFVPNDDGGHNVTGTWKLSNTAGDTLTGSITGTTKGIDIDLDLIVDAGSGYFNNASSGGGTFIGTTNGAAGDSPTAILESTLDIDVIRVP